MCHTNGNTYRLMILLSKSLRALTPFIRLLIDETVSAPMS